jgi:hypothetical protein
MSSSNVIKNVIKYFVRRRLAGDERFFKALEMIYVKNMSLSVVSNEIGLPRNTIKSIIVFLLRNLGSHARIAAVVKRVSPIVLSIEPIIVDVSPKSYRCKLCKKESTIGVRSMQPKLKHVEVYHSGLVDDYVNMVIKKIRGEPA